VSQLSPQLRCTTPDLIELDLNSINSAIDSTNLATEQTTV